MLMEHLSVGTGMVCPLDEIVHVGPKEANTRIWAWECRERYLEMKIEATLDWRGHSVESDKFRAPYPATVDCFVWICGSTSVKTGVA
jgi:hypothetical protein